MPAGRLNKRCVFQSPVETDDGGGGSSIVWTDGITVWGGLYLESARERVEAGRLTGNTVAALTVRTSTATEAITTADRVLINGQIFNIRSNENDDQHRKFQKLVVEAGVAT